jgi:hypothetical protein
MKILAALLLTSVPLPAQDWKQLEFLVGQWTGVAGEKDTQIGAGQGTFSFALDLNNKIIVRRNSAQYTSGITHDDLLIIYVEGSPRAIYFDSEGHVIRYNIAVPSENKVIFESDGAPKYRLTYWLDRESLNGTFEIGGKPYLNWTSKRKK